MLLATIKLRKLFWRSESPLWHGCPFLLCLVPQILRKQSNLGPISIIPKGWRQLKPQNGIKTKTFAMHFLFTIPNSQMLCRAQDVLTQRNISFKAREQQGHNEVLPTRGLFLTWRSFLLDFCEYFLTKQPTEDIAESRFPRTVTWTTPKGGPELEWPEHTFPVPMAYSTCMVYAPGAGPKTPEVPPNKIICHMCWFWLG